MGSASSAPRVAPSPSAILRAEKITKVYPDGTVALLDVDLEVRSGEILGLLGENGAGKTTLTKIISGLLPPTRGRVVSPQGPVRFSRPREALAFGIGMVHQHFALVGTLTAVENVALVHPGAGSPPRYERVRRLVEKLMAESGLRVPLDVPVEKLAVGEQQRVEILKVLSRNVQLLILDEPTSVLTPVEVDELFGFLSHLRQQGKSIILITHKLKEVLALADRIAVLRRGKLAGELTLAQASPEKLAQLMVGEATPRKAAVELQVGETVAERGQPQAGHGSVVLEVQNLTVPGDVQGLAVQGVSFAVREGEILGIAGVEGNGQSELVEALTGLRRAKGGQARIRGVGILNRDPRQIYRLGVAHIPEDRWKLGLVLPFTLAENAILGVHRWKEFRGPLGALRWRRIQRHVRSLIGQFGIQASGTMAPARSLSGGNQQKLIVGRELAKDPAVIIASQPTRGLDIGAAQYIRELLVQMKEGGRAILLVSADLDEVLSLSDRVAVMYGGKFMAVGSPGEFDRQRIGLLMGGVAR